LPCENCHKRALIYFNPKKYSSLIEENESTDVENEYKPSYRLPFEFNESDKLGPWDILLSEEAIKDIQKLELSLNANAIMKKLANISSGAWNKYGLRRKVISHDIPIYEDELSLPDKNLKILWQIDYGFSIRNDSLAQLVKIWSITDNQKDIETTESNLKNTCKVYAPENNYRYAINQMCENVILPKLFEDDEGTKSSNDMLNRYDMDNEKLLEVHKMLVTNKFTYLSKV
jgi:hypothetical protein